MLSRQNRFTGSLFGLLGLLVFVVTGGCASGARKSPNGAGPDSSAHSFGDLKIETREYKDEDGNLAKTLEGYEDEGGVFIPHGLESNLWPGGRKKSELTWVHGIKHGPAQAWYENGQLWWAQTYANDRENGTMTVWFIDGRKAEEYHMVEGAWHGKHTQWHPNGKKAMELEYVHGRKQGPMTQWDASGTVVRQAEYVDDKEQP